MHQRVEWLELRPEIGKPVATGTLACPDCDLPIALDGRAAIRDTLACGYCGAAGTVRDFLVLGEPTRPTRVVVRIR